MPTADEPRITVRLPQDMYDLVVRAAERESLSIGAVVRRALDASGGWDKLADEDRKRRPPAPARVEHEVEVPAKAPYLWRCPVDGCRVSSESMKKPEARAPARLERFSE